MTSGRAALGAFAAALALLPATARAGGEKPRIAVLGVSPGVPASAAAAVARAAAEAAREAGADAVPTDEVERAATASKQDVAACAKSPPCAVAVCGAARADALLIVRLTESGSVWLVEMRLREAKGGSIKGHAVEGISRSENAARDAAARLAGRVVQQYLSSGGLAQQGGARAPAASKATSTPTSTPTPTPTATSATPTSAPHPTPETAPDTAPSAPSVDERLVSRQGTRDARPTMSPRRWGAVGVAAAGVAMLAGGATAGALAWSESNAANASLARGEYASFFSGRESARNLTWAAAGLGGAGAVALASGAWLWFGGRSSRVSLQVDPGIAGARIAVAF